MPKKHTGLKLFFVFLAFALLGAFLVWGFGLIQKQLYPIQYEQYVEKYSRQYDVEIELVYAVIKCESGFRPDAYSSDKASGLMQITKDTFEWAQTKMPREDIGYDRIFEPEINIRYGVLILSLLRSEFMSDENVLCAYHAGWGQTQKWLTDSELTENSSILVERIPFSDTRAYVRRVLAAKERYRQLYQ